MRVFGGTGVRGPSNSARTPLSTKDNGSHCFGRDCPGRSQRSASAKVAGYWS